MDKSYLIEIDKFFNEPKTATQFRIKKFNRDNRLCYYDSIDLTGKGITEERLELFFKLFTRAGFETEIKTHTFFGIYDPSRMTELIEIYPTDEELLKKDLLYKKFKI